MGYAVMAVEVRGVCPLLQVYDMPASLRFYRDTLGFEVVATSPNLGGEDKVHWCLLRLCGSGAEHEGSSA
jgi:glyoxylase I family protein